MKLSPCEDCVSLKGTFVWLTIVSVQEAAALRQEEIEAIYEKEDVKEENGNTNNPNRV